MSESVAEARMGDPETIADRAATEYRCRPGAGKWMALSAVPAFLLGVILAGLIPVGIMSLIPDGEASTAQVESHNDEAWAARLDNQIVAASAWWLRTAPLLFAGAILCWWGVRVRARRPWLAAGFAQLAILAASFAVTFQPKTPDQLGQLMLGVHFPPIPTMSQLPALALVVAFAMIAWRRTTMPIARLH